MACIWLVKNKWAEFKAQQPLVCSREQAHGCTVPRARSSGFDGAGHGTRQEQRQPVAWRLGAGCWWRRLCCWWRRLCCWWPGDDHRRFDGHGDGRCRSRLAHRCRSRLAYLGGLHAQRGCGYEDWHRCWRERRDACGRGGGRVAGRSCWRHGPHRRWPACGTWKWADWSPGAARPDDVHRLPCRFGLLRLCKRTDNRPPLPEGRDGDGGSGRWWARWPGDGVRRRRARVVAMRGLRSRPLPDLLRRGLRRRLRRRRWRRRRSCRRCRGLRRNRRRAMAVELPRRELPLRGARVLGLRVRLKLAALPPVLEPHLHAPRRHAEVH